MYNKNEILLNLNAENYYIDRKTLSSFISMWKIDSVYENENNEEFYDDFAIERIKKGINLKAQGFSDEQIIVKLNKLTEPQDKPQEMTVLNNEPAIELTPLKSGLNNVTLDITSQTLQMLAEAVAKKITDDIKSSDMAEKLIEAGGYKKDNEILSSQISELIEHNKKLAERIEELEKKESFLAKLLNIFK